MTSTIDAFTTPSFIIALVSLIFKFFQLWSDFVRIALPGHDASWPHSDCLVARAGPVSKLAQGKEK